MILHAGPEAATPLHVCSDDEFGSDRRLDAARVDCARLLIAAGADLNAPDEAGRSVLRFTVLGGDARLPLTELLLASGASYALPPIPRVPPLGIRPLQSMQVLMWKRPVGGAEAALMQLPVRSRGWRERARLACSERM